VIYGHTCDVFNERRVREAPRFIADGLFTNVSDKSPTYAGVLAFAEVGFRSVADPVLYHHPRFKGQLPEALSVLEQHWYVEDAGVNSVKIRPAISAGLLEAFGFVKE
jgi:histidyl-tRNA synthetase